MANVATVELGTQLVNAHSQEIAYSATNFRFHFFLVFPSHCEDGFMDSEDDSDHDTDHDTDDVTGVAEPVDVAANVLVAQECGVEPEVVVRAAQSVTRWCVDSGANRDICRDEQLFAGNAKPKVISIGEAGQGHCFTSKAEGPISLRLKGEQLPLFTRTIFADQVNENIMSVPEAVDGGYTVIFTAEGVKMYKASDCTVGTPVIIGTRDKRNRLFYVHTTS